MNNIIKASNIPSGLVKLKRRMEKIKSLLYREVREYIANNITLANMVVSRPLQA